MPDREKRTFSHKELAEILVKHAGIHAGLWGIFVEFGLGAANIPLGGPDGEFSLKPAAVVPVNSIGILQFDEPTPLTVDAAQVNPKASPNPKSSLSAERPRRAIIRRNKPAS
jgi:hypothetical protein